MQVNHEITHQGVIDGFLRRGFPSMKSGFIVWINANDIERAGVSEIDRFNGFEFPAEYQV